MSELLYIARGVWLDPDTLELLPFFAGGIPSGGGGSAQTTTTKNDTTVNVSTSVTGPPITISIADRVLQPLQETFAPLTQGVTRALDFQSDQFSRLLRFVSDESARTPAALGATDAPLLIWGAGVALLIVAVVLWQWR